MMENNDPTSAFYQAYNLNTVPHRLSKVRRLSHLAQPRLERRREALYLQL